MRTQETNQHLVESKPVSELSVHPEAQRLPEWPTDHPRFKAFTDDVRRRGIQQPILIDHEGRILDGRMRLRAAKQLRIDELMCVVIADDVINAILQSLLQRRHYTRGALAYLAFPLLADAFDEARRRRLENLKNTNVSSKSTDGLRAKTVEDFAQMLGISRSLLFQAQQLHRRFESDPELRAEFEPAILEEEKGLGGILAGTAGKLATSVSFR
jgi:hypothetical protein